MQKARARGYLLYNRVSGITAKNLAQLMNLIPIKDAANAFRFGLGHQPPTVRYGNSDGNFHFDTNLNAPNVIRLCADSVAFSRWAERNGVYSPMYNPFNYRNPPPFPFLLRARYHHGGLDIKKITSIRDIHILPWEQLENRFAVSIIPTQYELRVHVIDGLVAKIFIKKPTEQVREGDFIRSSYKGWRYVLADSNKYAKARQLAEEVCNKLGIKFAGIDMAWDKEKGQYVIWEINTAPGLNTNTTLEYAGILNRIIRV